MAAAGAARTVVTAAVRQRRDGKVAPDRRRRAPCRQCARPRRRRNPEDPLIPPRHRASVADLGELWERETGLPVPLAGICARSDLEDETRQAAEAAIRASVEHAFAHPQASREYVRAHSQELSDEVCDAHIRLYVNDFSIDLGDEGLRAVDALCAA